MGWVRKGSHQTWCPLLFLPFSSSGAIGTDDGLHLLLCPLLALMLTLMLITTMVMTTSNRLALLY